MKLDVEGFAAHMLEVRGSAIINCNADLIS